MAAVDKVTTKDGRTYYIERLTDPAVILSLLEPKRAYAAYAICQLEPERFPYTRWYLAKGDAGEALVMHSLGSLESNLWGYGAGLFCMGDPAALDALLSLHPGPRFVQAKAQMEHLTVLKRHFRLRSEEPVMLHLRTIANVRPVEGPVKRLTGADIGAINRLYRSRGGFLSLFRGYRRQLIDRSVWYGLFEDGRLVSVGGTQAISRTYGVAYGGYLLTHPKYRGRGYASMVRSARMQAILTKCSLSVGHYNPANKPHVRIHLKVGREFLMNVLDTPALRRDLLGLASLARRFLARRRGKAPASGWLRTRL